MHCYEGFAPNANYVPGTDDVHVPASLLSKKKAQKATMKKPGSMKKPAAIKKPAAMKKA